MNERQRDPETKCPLRVLKSRLSDAVCCYEEAWEEAVAAVGVGRWVVYGIIGSDYNRLIFSSYIYYLFDCFYDSSGTLQLA